MTMRHECDGCAAIAGRSEWCAASVAGVTLRAGTVASEAPTVHTRSRMRFYSSVKIDAYIYMYMYTCVRVRMCVRVRVCVRVSCAGL